MLRFVPGTVYSASFHICTYITVHICTVVLGTVYCSQHWSQFGFLVPGAELTFGKHFKSHVIQILTKTTYCSYTEGWGLDYICTRTACTRTIRTKVPSSVANTYTVNILTPRFRSTRVNPTIIGYLWKSLFQRIWGIPKGKVVGRNVLV